MVIKPQRELIKRIIAATAAFTIASGVAAQAATPITYSDVSSNDWYYSYVVDASEDGIVNGYEDGTFRADNQVALGECIKMILNYKGIKCENGSYHWASNYADKAYELGIMQWGEFENLDVKLNRQQVAKLVMLALGEKDVAVDTSKITDYALIQDAYKPYVAQAYAKGIITGYEDGSFLGEKTINRAEVLAVLMRAFDTESRVQSGSSDKKDNIAYARKDITIRIDGVYTAIEDGWVVQYGDQMYINQDLLGIGSNYYGVAGYSSAWDFQHAWSVDGSITPISVQRSGRAIEYDAENKILYIGSKEPVFYANPNAKRGMTFEEAEACRNTYPIVSYLEDPSNCWVNTGVDKCTFDGSSWANNPDEKAGLDMSNYLWCCGITPTKKQWSGYSHTILNVTGYQGDILVSAGGCTVYDIETGEQLPAQYLDINPGIHSGVLRVTLRDSRYIVIKAGNGQASNTFSESASGAGIWFNV